MSYYVASKYNKHISLLNVRFLSNRNNNICVNLKQLRPQFVEIFVICMRRRITAANRAPARIKQTECISNSTCHEKAMLYAFPLEPFKVFCIGVIFSLFWIQHDKKKCMTVLWVIWTYYIIRNTYCSFEKKYWNYK